MYWMEVAGPLGAECTFGTRLGRRARCPPKDQKQPGTIESRSRLVNWVARSWRGVVLPKLTPGGRVSQSISQSAESTVPLPTIRDRTTLQGQDDRIGGGRRKRGYVQGRAGQREG